MTTTEQEGQIMVIERKQKKKMQSKATLVSATVVYVIPTKMLNKTK